MVRLLIKRTWDVEFFVYDLRRRIYSQIRGKMSHGWKISWLDRLFPTHRDEEKHHARQGEATGVAQIAWIATRKTIFRAGKL